MLKTCSIMAVIGFLAFWALGFLAFTGNASETLTVFYIMLAFSGLALGSFSYLRLCRNNPK